MPGSSDSRDGDGVDEGEAPGKALAFVYDTPELIRRFVLAELLAPPLALRRRSSSTSTSTSTSASTSASTKRDG